VKEGDEAACHASECMDEAESPNKKPLIPKGREAAVSWYHPGSLSPPGNSLLRHQHAAAR